MAATAATVVLAIIITATPVGAIDVGCTAPANKATVYSTAGSAEGVGWAPECVRVITGSFLGAGGSVDFTNLDPIFHQPVAAGCFDAFTVNLGQTKTLSGLRTAGGKAFVGFEACDETAQQARTGTFIPRTEGDKLPVVEKGVDGPGTVTIHYICAFHGAAMHGKIVLSTA